MKKFLSVLMSILVLSTLILCAFAVEYPNDMSWLEDENRKYFYDVVNDDWYAEYANEAYVRGLFSGSFPNSYVWIFSPDDLLTREQAVVVLNRMAEGWNHHKETPIPYATGFADVPEDKWYAYSVCWAKESGITTGVADGVFGIGKTITREELATLIARYIEATGLTLSPDEGAVKAFSDVEDVSEWASESVELMRKSGILHGDENCNFRPCDMVTRAEAAAVVVRLEDSIVYESEDLFAFSDGDVTSISFNFAEKSIKVTDPAEVKVTLEKLRSIKVSGSKSFGGLNGGRHATIVIRDENDAVLFSALFKPDRVLVDDNRLYYFDASYLQDYYDILSE